MPTRPRPTMAFQLFARLPFSIVGAVSSPSLIIPYYHVVSDDDLVHVKHLYDYKGVRAFRDDLDFLLAHYAPIGLADLLDHRHTGRRLPPRAVLLTFDDGYREMADVVAPILLEKGLTATFFVNTAFTDNRHLCYLNKVSLLVDAIDRARSHHLERALLTRLQSHQLPCHDARAGILSIDYRQRHVLDDLAGVIGVDFSAYLGDVKPYLSSGDIAWLVARGFTIGGHSVDHPLYSALPLDEQLHQTIESVTAVKRAFHLRYGAFAFPHTDHGVSKRFFDRLAESASVDVSFGTAGLMRDSVPNHFQRFSLEKPVASAERILAFHHARRLKKVITMNSTVRRA